MSDVSQSAAPLWERLRKALESQTLLKGVLSKPHPRQTVPSPKLTWQPVMVRGERMYQWTSRISRQEHHENLPAEQTYQRIRTQFGTAYRELYLFTAEADVAARHFGDAMRMTVRPPSLAPQPADHNRRKPYLIPEGQPCPFLEALGVMTAAGTVLGKRQHKFRQINRYLELVDDIYAALPAEGCLHVVDFGCGLSYLTFAVHHLLHEIHGRDVQIVGIDRNPEVIARCTGITEALMLAGLRFVVGEIGDPELERSAAPLHLAISLHACDVATDAALAYAVRHRAQVILAAPCCQHELTGKLDDPSLKLITMHGILRERLAALATDALRAAALEAAGYHAQVIEFIETEHTPKNLMIRAVRRDAPGDMAVWRQRYEEFRHRLGAAALASDQILPEEIVPKE